MGLEQVQRDRKNESLAYPLGKLVMAAWLPSQVEKQVIKIISGFGKNPTWGVPIRGHHKISGNWIQVQFLYPTWG